MKFSETGIYHIYNMGNNREKIFYTDANYSYFLNKCQDYLKPVSDILAWCLMPNHFHFLIDVTEISLASVACGSLSLTALSNGFRIVESSYAQAINTQEDRVGNLFRQKTKAKLTYSDYAINVFHYIHRNPLAAGLVKDPIDWPYSSYPQYVEGRNGLLISKSRAYSLLKLDDVDIRLKTLENMDEKLF